LPNVSTCVGVTRQQRINHTGRRSSLDTSGRSGGSRVSGAYLPAAPAPLTGHNKRPVCNRDCHRRCDTTQEPHCTPNTHVCKRRQSQLRGPSRRLAESARFEICARISDRRAPRRRASCKSCEGSRPTLRRGGWRLNTLRCGTVRPDAKDCGGPWKLQKPSSCDPHRRCNLHRSNQW